MTHVSQPCPQGKRLKRPLETHGLLLTITGSFLRCSYYYKPSFMNTHFTKYVWNFTFSPTQLTSLLTIYTLEFPKYLRRCLALVIAITFPKARVLLEAGHGRPSLSSIVLTLQCPFQVQCTLLEGSWLHQSHWLNLNSCYSSCLRLWVFSLSPSVYILAAV